jgi:hypothetical protein
LQQNLKPFKIIDMNEQNIFTDLRNVFSSVRNGLGQLSGDENYVKTAYYDNPNHIYDNLLKFFQFVLFACAGASLFFGISYHYKLFLQTGQERGVSVGLAVLLFVIAEVISVYIGVLFFRFMWTGKIFKSLQHLIFFLIMGFLIFKAFMFRMDISAKAYAAQNANEQKTELAQRGVDSSRTITKSKYDKEIEKAQNMIEKGKGQTWRGKLTPRGEYLVQEGNATLQKYLDLRKEELSIKVKADSLLNNSLGGIINLNQKQLNGYGGMVEWAVLILTCLIALLEKISYIENKKTEEKEDNTASAPSVEPNQPIGFRNIQSVASSQDLPNNKPIAEAKLDSTERRPIGFFPNKNKINSIDIEKEEKKNSMKSA